MRLTSSLLQTMCSSSSGSSSSSTLLLLNEVHSRLLIIRGNSKASKKSEIDVAEDGSEKAGEKSEEEKVTSRVGKEGLEEVYYSTTNSSTTPLPQLVCYSTIRCVRYATSSPPA